MAQRYPGRFRRHLRPRSGDQLGRPAARRHPRRPCDHGRRLDSPGAGQARRRRRAGGLRRAGRRADGLVEDAVGCKARFDPAKLLCAGGPERRPMPERGAGRGHRTLHAPYKFPFALANGVDRISGLGRFRRSHESLRPDRRMERVVARRSTARAAAAADNGIAWIYGAGGIQHIFARDPNFDVAQISAGGFRGAGARGLGADGFDQPRSQRVQGPWRQAHHA